jgi:hypothetical protein
LSFYEDLTDEGEVNEDAKVRIVSMSPPAFQRAERLAKRVRLVYSFRRLTLRSATGTAQRARPYRRGADPKCAAT